MSQTVTSLAVGSDSFRAAMRLPATSVAIIASGSGPGRAGLAASAVCSLSDDPPMILACINLRSPCLPVIRSSGVFSANFLTDAQVPVVEAFSGRAGLYGADRFAVGSWTTLATGAPVLADALSVFDCDLEREHESPTHAILIGRVRGLAQNASRSSLVYAAGLFASPKALAS